jgi:hypothetical protein
LVANPVYGSEIFRRRFRISKGVYERIRHELVNQYECFRTLTDAAKKEGITTDVKLTAVLRFLAYGCSADFIDENYQIAECTLLKYLRLFCRGIISTYKTEYLRMPNA